MRPDELRALGDRTLFERLKKDRLVRRTCEWLEEREEESPLRTRRQLLATAVRLTPGMAPGVHKIIDRCREALAVAIPLEVYVYSSPQFNAACVKPEQGRLFILLSSSLLEGFRGRELDFVIGHELGHYVFGHHDIPIGVIAKGKERPRPELLLQLFSWSRYAEISADRAGAHCAQDPDAVATALFRLSSGLRTDLVTVRLDEFAAQIDDMMEDSSGDPAARAKSSDWFSTHPFSPLRVQALQRYAESVLVKEGGESVAELEAHIATLMALMEPSYLDEKTDTAELMRRTLFAGAIAVANADGAISEAEVEVIRDLFGHHAFSDRLNIDAIAQNLTHRVEEMNERVAPPRKVQVIRDLCLVVRAEGAVDQPGRRILEALAEQLEVPAAVVSQTLAAQAELD